jgi:hypothetical protein
MDSPDNPYERLQKVNKTQNQEILALEEGNLYYTTSPNPFDKLKSINKTQYQEYLKYANQRDKTKANAAAFFLYGPRLLQSVVLILVVVATCAYIVVLLKL